MHYAYPPRKSSNPPPFRPRSTWTSPLRPRQVKTAAIVIGALFFLVWMLSGSSKTVRTVHVPSGRPSAVVVTVLEDKSRSLEYVKNVKDNRIQYAELHGYETFIASPADYDLDDAPPSWTKVVAMRHAMTKYPDCKYLWFLEEDAFIMNPSLKIEDYIMGASKLETNMIRDIPVVPPDSIITTSSTLKGSEVHLALAQDNDGLVTGSFVLRNSEWAKFFLETWFDPLYRSYNFVKAEEHALEHMVQWHPTVLNRLAILPQRVMSAYSRAEYGAQYKDGDIAVIFAHCSGSGDSSCDTEAERYVHQWRTSFHNFR